MEVARWSHDFAPHAMVDLTPLAGDATAMDAAVAGALKKML
jgi:hypothetical protein